MMHINTPLCGFAIQSASIQVVNSGIVILRILNDIDSCRIIFFYKYTVFPSVSSLVFFDSTLWHIQSGIIKSIKRESTNLYELYRLKKTPEKSPLETKNAFHPLAATSVSAPMAQMVSARLFR